MGGWWGPSLGRRFNWLWASFAVSTFGTRLAFDAFPLIAVLVLHAGPAEVAALAATGTAVGALVAVPLGPWVEFRRKRPVMVATDLVRCGALLTVPVAFALDALTFIQLLVVSVIVAASDIAFTAASGAFLRSLLPKRELLAAGARLESTSWTATVLGPPLGGAAIGLFGPVLTVFADAVSHLLSAVGLRAIGGTEKPPPVRDEDPAAPGGSLLDGWRYILGHRELRPLFFNSVLVNSLIMASAPPLLVLMVGDLGFAPWQYGLAFAVPCLGGLFGARLAGPLVARYGRRRVLLAAGTARACWSIGLAAVGPGVGGLVLVMVVELGLITCSGVFNPVYSAYRLERTARDRIARTLSAWTVTSRTAVAAATALWGLLAGVAGPRTAIAVAGALLLATPLLLPRGELIVEPEAVPAPRDPARPAAAGETSGDGG
ncbi:MFS transporter [Streptomyces sp. NPDC005840]|uniref:MFS transporter n=1 Tax=Streptomyces sp. NPDC005840 TaxID=3157072 RepID=UPI00340DDFEB